MLYILGRALSVYNCLRLSLAGINFNGVWYTFGALGGGLKMICEDLGIESSMRRVGFCGPKDGAGGIDSFLMCRR
jgi:hypothetical protein